MKVFLTGASGFIGGSIAAGLLRAGHHVRGLVRSQEKAEALRALGIDPVVGDLDSAELLEAEAHAADAVVSAASSDHRVSVEALLRGLKGSGKAFLHTSGSSVIADDACGNYSSDAIFDESTPFVVPEGKLARQALDNLILAAANDNVRSVVLCNTMIYGNGLGLARDSVQIPLLAKEGRLHGTVRVIGKGANVWSNVHIEDVVDLYLLALAKAPAGAFYWVENGEAAYGEIAQAIARRLNKPFDTWSIEEACKVWGHGHCHYALASNSRVRAVRARKELGWQPKHASVIDWIEQELPLE
eukprot:m.166697 g.166697  ORF g.166697 m.166697 type:complete len:300 (-) comp17177_c0_seq2:1039-1938(-)